jgi:hypothetical protein
MPSMQEPPFWHGLAGEQSSMLWSQFAPSQPGAHEQV